jgi:putative ABC transport system permease protein
MWRLVLKNLLRNKRRTLLTASSVAVSLFLLSSLAMFYAALGRPVEDASGSTSLRLMVSRSTGIMYGMPSSYEARIAALQGVAACTPMNFLGAYYGDSSNYFANFAVGHETIFAVYKEANLPADQLAAFKRERLAAVTGRHLAEKFHWKLGDRIALLGSFYGVTPQVILRGIYTAPNLSDEDMFFLHWDYFNELMDRPDVVNSYWVRVNRPESAPRVAKAIDAMFRNTFAETKTETESQFLLGFISMLGNVRGIILAIGAAVTFAILLIVANTMAMSIRERIPEAAVMRSLGFRARQIVGLFLGESLVLTLAGWLVGCGGAKLLYDALALNRIGEVAWADFRMRPETVLFCFALAFGMGLLASGLPAYRASRLNIAQALRFVG